MISPSGPTIHDLPLFPLPDFFLFPGAVAPLHVFEPRYRQMVDDLLDTSGRLVLAAYRPDGARTDRGPQVMPVAGLGEIVNHETLADGRYLIWVLGLGRVCVEETPSDRLYRKAAAHLLTDHDIDDGVESRLLPRLLEAIDRWAPGGQVLEGELPLGLMADILLNALPLDASRTAAVFAEACPTTRARQALAWSRALDSERS